MVSSLRLAVGLAVLAVALGAPRVARADDAESDRVPLTVDVEGEVRVKAGTFASRCDGPCTLHVPRGFVEVTAENLSRELYVEGPSRITASRGAPGVRAVAGVALLAGIVVTAAAVVVPLLVCKRGETRTDAFGRTTTDPSPCSDLSDGVKVAWIAGGGIGLTAAIAGGIVYVTSAPRLHVSEVAGPAPSPTSLGGALTIHF